MQCALRDFAREGLGEQWHITISQGRVRFETETLVIVQISDDNTAKCCALADLCHTFTQEKGADALALMPGKD